MFVYKVILYVPLLKSILICHYNIEKYSDSGLLIDHLESDDSFYKSFITHKRFVT